MISLRTKGKAYNINETYIGPIIDVDGSEIIWMDARPVERESLNEKIMLSTLFVSDDQNKKLVHSVQSLDHLEIGDIVTIEPGGTIRTVFRKSSANNSLFVTDRCNSNCLMCSQPPKNKSDIDFFYQVNSRLVTLIPKDTPELGITGGEPTLSGAKLSYLLSQIKQQLPDTAVHVLTNGRACAWKEIPFELSQAGNRNTVFGIPLYSDHYFLHDFTVQARHAFSQTMLGFHNMERFGLRTELRVVLHKLTYKRLAKLARFIFRNLPFVEHIAFMGLEYTGYTPYNKALLWIEPSDYMNELMEAVLFLDAVGMNVSIYNHPLCLLPPALWPFTRKSISDWKREYLAECSKCSVLDKCGGVFGTSKVLSDHIQPLSFSSTHTGA